MPDKIKIVYRCDQDWNQMRESDGNKFCDLCKKEVVDLTSLSRKDLRDQIKHSKNTCRKINQSQLYDDYGQMFNIKYLNKAALLVGLGAIIGINEPALANKKSHRHELYEKADWQNATEVKKFEETITIVGKIVDPDGEPLLGATIKLKGRRIVTTTDFNGNFAIAIPISEIEKENHLLISFPGYDIAEYQLLNSNIELKKPIYIQLNTSLDKVVLGLIAYTPSLWERIKSFFRRLF